jgi:hypothetical protein
MKAYPTKTPLRTPCSWPPWPMFCREESLKDFQSFVKIQNFDPHFKICILQENGFKEPTLVLFESLF